MSRSGVTDTIRPEVSLQRVYAVAEVHKSDHDLFKVGTDGARTSVVVQSGMQVRARRLRRGVRRRRRRRHRGLRLRCRSVHRDRFVDDEARVAARGRPPSRQEIPAKESRAEVRVVDANGIVPIQRVIHGPRRSVGLWNVLNVLVMTNGDLTEAVVVDEHQGSVSVLRVRNPSRLMVRPLAARRAIIRLVLTTARTLFAYNSDVRRREV